MYYVAGNIALYRPASQSSSYDALTVASKGNDGIENTAYIYAGCMITAFEYDPWWVVDLKMVHNVIRVDVVNRGGGN